MTKLLSTVLFAGALLVVGGCGSDRCGGTPAAAPAAESGCTMACCVEAKAAGKVCDKCGCAKKAAETK
jgi:hypothetical protein